MNIDERLERLAERHEALAQSVEMMNASFREQVADRERRDREMDKRINNLLAAQERIVAVQEIDGEHIRALARIAEIHEHRISHLEGDSPT